MRVKIGTACLAITVAAGVFGVVAAMIGAVNGFDFHGGMQSPAAHFWAPMSMALVHLVLLAALALFCIDLGRPTPGAGNLELLLDSKHAGHWAHRRGSRRKVRPGRWPLHEPEASSELPADSRSINHKESVLADQLTS